MSREQERKLLKAITDIPDDLKEQAQDVNLQAASQVAEAYNTSTDNMEEKAYRRDNRTKRSILDTITSRTKPKSSNTTASGARWKAWSAAAACVILAAGLGGVLLWHGLSPFGGKAGSNTAGSGGSGHQEGSTFMSYAGPVFPLTLAKAQNDITASRHISFDFSPPDDDYRRIWGASVKDSYVLSNHSEQDITITALYPFAGSLADLAKLQPSITAGKEIVQPVLHTGGYSGGFIGVLGADDQDGSINIKRLEGWEDYKTLLQDGSYQQDALSPFPEFDQKVTVYEFSDFKAPLEQYPAATQAISFSADNSRTTILTYGFEGGEWHKDGFRRYSFFVPDGVSMRSNCKMLIVLGDDIESYSLEGYKNGATEKGNELDGVTCTITRYEAVLSDIIDRLIIEHLSHYKQSEGLPAGVSMEMVYGAAADLLTLYGPLGGSTTERYQDGRLDDIIAEAYVLDRVFYLEFPVTIPAGESVSVTADLYKDPSYDFACSGSDNIGLQGYDMVTRLGSSLDFEKQSAEVINTELIEIVRQNFGFDLQNNLTKVILDPAIEHYYLEVRTLS